MKWASGVIALAVVVATVAAQSGANSSNPCAIVNSLAANTLSESSNATSLSLKPSDVYECLRSVPYDQGKDVHQIEWLQSILELQSTLAYLKDPPKSYPLPAVDLVGGLKNISDLITSGKYTNEYDIELDLYNLIDSANDGHLVYQPALLTAVLYNRNVSLVSVSIDGIQTPKVYIKSDIERMFKTNSTPSAVSFINGISAEDYLSRSGSGMQDLDAMYNSALYRPTISPQTDDSITIANGVFTEQNDTTLFAFENGTNREIDATAIIVESSAANLLEDGQHIFDSITSVGDNTTASLTQPPPKSPLGPNYPSPVVQSQQNFMSGYFMNGSGNSDIAVLSVSSFYLNTSDPAAEIDFQRTASTFLAKCASAGKKRLIVDVRNNPGGVYYHGYGLFQQLFPNIVPYSGIRMRASDVANTIGEIASSNAVQDDFFSLSAFDIETNLQPNGTEFDSWHQFYGPIRQHGDLFSNVGALKQVTNDYASYVVDYASNRTSLPAQVFSSESITLLTDGLCSSTCGIFANLMINQGRVKTATVGGRPNNQPMAVVGGTQGANLLELAALQLVAKQVINVQANYTGNSSTETNETRRRLESLTSDPPIMVPKMSINFLDSIAQNDTSMTPLQFTGGIAANCRFYYMPADITNVTNTWARVAEGVKARGKGLCVNGTMTDAATVGRNGSDSLPFQGAGSTVRSASVRWTVVLVALGTMATVLL